MATCSYCKRKVSPDAKSCPGCGKGNPAKMGGFALVCLVVVIVVILSGL